MIRDSASGPIVCMPPEAHEVPGLMAALVRWIRDSENTELPVPLIAGLAHYQFVTIHPYFDGNGRTARLLATFLLHRGGFGMKGLISLNDRITAHDVASLLGLSVRMARVLLTKWVGDGWLTVADPSRRKRAYELTAIYRQHLSSLSAMEKRGK